PIVGLAAVQPELGFRDCAWVEPTLDWPGWLSGDEIALISNHAGIPYRESLPHLRELFSLLEDSIRQAFGGSRRQDEPRGAVAAAPPDWLILYALHFGIEGLDSAGLTVALQRLSEFQGRRIPVGV